MQTTKIYVLTEPDGTIRYLGKTSQKLLCRFKRHLSDAKGGKKYYRLDWIRSLLKEGLLPKIQLVGEVEGNGEKEEIAWINYLKDEGYHLTNLTAGGDGIIGYKPTLAVRQKLSLSLLGNKHSAGSIWTPERRAKHIIRMKGNQYTKGKRHPRLKRKLKNEIQISSQRCFAFS